MFSLYLQLGCSNFDTHPDVDLKTPDLVRKYGYPLEIYNIVTRDGYILELHRIPNSRFNKNRRQLKKKPVLLQHGLAGSSADWVLMGPDKSLGFFLADAGFDVWLGNNRGNIYSRNHTFMTPTDRYFWDFSFHQLGMEDLPAMIDFILSRTGNERLFFVGHSQGTTQFWVMASERPEYNSRVILTVGLAPAAFTGNLRGPVRKLTKLTYFGVWVGENFGYPEFGSRTAWAKFVSNLVCDSKAPTQFICSNLLFLVAGFSHGELNMENLTVIIGHVPAGASWKCFIHFGQGFIHPGHFRQFDYGNTQLNMKVYGSPFPPKYSLENVTTPVALFSSANDWLAAPSDVELLQSGLSNVILNHKIPMNNFNHYDFIWGRTAAQMIFEPVLQLLRSYE
ncbi:lipase 3-like [Leptopilina heterotoma]|uniref:lipase 3-like n=1 Tax=Leptopilina heterotoma TaxID=63436 RepID=UPI001CA7D21E|nr:lipase 3-like [Leptopilina heterotoma]